jgi:hypothetical protein
MTMNLAQFYLQGFLVAALIGITTYYAVQTKRQADLLAKQINASAEQRRKAIRPLLQVDRISYWFHDIELPDIHKEAIVPGIELRIKNVGTGPALNLEISASAAINVTRGNIFEGIFCKLHWELVATSKDAYLEHTLEPVYHRLNLVQVDRSFPADIVAQKKLKQKELDEIKREMHIRFKYRDIDQTPLTELRIIHIGSDISPLQFAADESSLIPGDPDYPENILISI